MTAPVALQQYYASGGPFTTARAGDYRYLSTNILSGALMGDWLPFEPQSFSMVINGGGTFAGSLDLIPGSPQQNLVNLQAITPRKAVLWVIQSGTPIWNGILWDWVPTTVLQQQLPVQAATMESILGSRLIDQDLVFTDADVFTMANGLVQFAFSKSPDGQVAGITYSSALSGITDSVTFDGSQLQSALDALGTLVTTYGIEFSFRPYMSARGNLLTNFDLGYPSLGQPYPQSGLAYSFPGNLLDYEFTATGSSGANRVVATAQAAGDSGDALIGSAIDDTDIGNGYPLTEMSISATGVNFTTDAQLDSYAAGILPSVTATQLSPVVVLGNGQYPYLNVTQLGSYASVAFTSAMHPAGPNGEPGFTATGRVVSWTCYPPTSQQAEYSQIQLGDMPFEGSVLAGQAITTGSSASGATGSTGGSSGTGSTGSGPVSNLAVTTASLPAATVSAAYTATLTATGGTGVGYAWSVPTGSLPSGLTLAASSGVISGTPTSAGTADFAVRVTDSSGATADTALSITVAAAASTLAVTTASLPAATAGTAYSATLTATGGTGSGYTWTVSSGSLPSGLTLAASTGVISGTPSAAATDSPTFEVTDSASNTATKALTLTVNGSAQPSGPSGNWTLKWNDEFNNAAGMSGSGNGLARSKWNVGWYYGPSSPGGTGYNGTSYTASSGGGAVEFYGPGALTFPSGGGMELSCFAPGDGPDGASYNTGGHSSTQESGGVNTAGLMCFTTNTGYTVPSAIESTVIQAAHVVIEVRCQMPGPDVIAGDNNTLSGGYWPYIGLYNAGDCSTPDYPSSGQWTEEIDIWEGFGENGSLGKFLYLTFHEASSYGSVVSTPSSMSGTDMSLEYHTYTVEFTYSSVNLWVDGVAVSGISPSAAEVQAQFAQPQYLNIQLQLTAGYVATGASYDGETATPMKVGYVRVFTQ